MIFGIGIDIINQDRIEQSWKKYKNKLIKRILNNKEIEILEFKKTSFNLKKEHQNFIIKSIAKKFSASEALSKAIGTGISKDCQFHDITLNKNNLGKPIINISGNTHNNLTSIISGSYKIHITFSDEKIQNNNLLISSVIIEKY